jgi:TPP-dependent pyruvate/acetoin dehydrogenase alpha subunit
MATLTQPASASAATPGIERHGLTDERLLDLYRTMLRIRRFEERVKELFLEARLYGSVHLYIGEEGVATGACAALEEGDVISSTHRGHGHCIAKGLELAPMMAELMGKATGYNHGKGGSMHIASLDHGMLGANGIVAAGIPISTGAALGFWVRGSPEVALCFFGDGGANHGAFHEGINFAATLKLPVVFVCENNQYAQYHAVKQDLPIENVADRAAAYGIPGVIVDGSRPRPTASRGTSWATPSPTGRGRRWPRRGSRATPWCSSGPCCSNWGWPPPSACRGSTTRSSRRSRRPSSSARRAPSRGPTCS